MTLPGLQALAQRRAAGAALVPLLVLALCGPAGAAAAPKGPCSGEPRFAWQPPLQAEAVYRLPRGGTLPVAFTYTDCAGNFIRDESVLIAVTDPANPKHYVNVYVHGRDIAIDGARRLYHQEFRPDRFGLAPGTTLVVKAYLGGKLAGQARVQVTGGSAAASTLAASPALVLADGTSAAKVMVQARDDTGAALTTGGDQVTLATTLGTLSPVTDHGDGTYTATLRGTRAGTAVITGSLNGTAMAARATVTLVPAEPDAAAAFLKELGQAAGAVAGALRDLFRLGAPEVAAALIRAGYTAPELAGALRDVFALGADAVAGLLRQFGYDAATVGGILQAEFAQGADAAAATLRGAGYGASEVADALRSAYGASREEAAAALKQAGYTATEAAWALKEAYPAKLELGFVAMDMTPLATARALLAAGYPADAVAGALQSAFHGGAEGCPAWFPGSRLCHLTGGC